RRAPCPKPGFPSRLRSAEMIYGLRPSFRSYKHHPVEGIRFGDRAGLPGLFLFPRSLELLPQPGAKNHARLRVAEAIRGTGLCSSAGAPEEPDIRYLPFGLFLT